MPLTITVVGDISTIAHRRGIGAESRNNAGLETTLISGVLSVCQIEGNGVTLVIHWDGEIVRLLAGSNICPNDGHAVF